MKKTFKVIGILIIISIFIVGAFKYGYLAGLKGQVEIDNSINSTFIINPTEDSNVSATIIASKVVSRVSVETTLVLRGKLVEVSVPDKFIVIKAKSGEDTLKVYFGENATMHVPFPGTSQPPKLDIAKLSEFLGQDITVIATLGKSQILEGATFFPKDLDIRL